MTRAVIARGSQSQVGPGQLAGGRNAPPLRGRSLTFWKFRCRPQSLAPTHMPAKKCGLRPAFTGPKQRYLTLWHAWPDYTGSLITPDLAMRGRELLEPRSNDQQ